MLRYLTLANWKSVYNSVEYSMVATNERSHGERLARVGRTRVLPVSALYGANAAGKSAFVEGLAALQGIVRAGRSRGERIPVVPHRLKGVGEPTIFGAEFVVAAPDDGPGRRRDWTFYYELSADRNSVHTESLVRLRSRDEEVLYERRGDQLELFGELEENPAAQALRWLLAPNTTVLGELGGVDAAPDSVRRAWSWFDQQLRIIRPRAGYSMLPAPIEADKLFADAMNHGLSVADTGIDSVRLEDFNISSLPPGLLQEYEDTLSANDESMIALVGDLGEYGYLSLDDSGVLRAQRLVAVHRGKPGPDGSASGEFVLPMVEESEGTVRFMNLLPMLFQLGEESSRKVFVVDELENSMHPMLTQELVRSFLEDLDQDNRRQFIFTTHEIQLMRARILRRDEMWLVDKIGSQTQLTRMSDFSRSGVRKDADILSLYTSGRLGGVPRT